MKYKEEVVIDDKNDDETIGKIIELIKEKSPLDFSDYKQATILRRTKRRAAQLNFTSLTFYLEFLKQDSAEAETLARDFLISVTSFFRDKEAFEFIKTDILPGLINKLVPGEELKLWVAGCATGEEVYSLAILVAEQLAIEKKDTVVKLFATDIDSVALVHAGKAIYSSNIINDVPLHLLERYFLKEGNNYRVSPVIRKMVIFAHHDLIKNPPYCNMHFISCRNLLIYMTPVLQKKVYALLLFGLRLGGYLFLGSSESPMPILKNLEVVNKKWKIYKSIKSKRIVSFDVFSLPEMLETKYSSGRPFSDSIKNTNSIIAEAVNDAIMRQTGNLIVCIDENNLVIKTYGDTTKFLLQKNFNSNLAELLPKPLAVAFNTLSNTVLKTKEQASVRGITFEYNQQVIQVRLSIAPLQIKSGNQNALMVTFSEDINVAEDLQTETVVFDEKIYFNQYTQNLEEELKELKTKLHTTYEQLDASNENMQSFNEELLSANEEMQSTNEEMQSVNEELDTINSDYQLKNKELLEINDDLNNYFRSNINGQLFINNDLLLMKFSPGTVNLINLLDTDIGRPISNISTNIKFETIIDDIKQVLAEGVVLTKEIETNNGKWYQSMTMPYIQQADNKRNGAIITFNDITELKKTQNTLDQKNKSLLRINADLDHFIHAASHDLLAPLSNIETSINVMNKIKLSDNKLTDFLNIINDSVKKFSSLIKDIATIAKVEGDMIATESVDLNEIMDNIEWSLGNKITESGAVINRRLEVKNVVFSKKNLRSIVYNLTSNAIKFRREEVSPVINVYTRLEDDYIILTVEDNGIGIPERGLAKIFDMYGRLNNDVEGFGIGLFLAKKIINAANGTIKVESEPGKGSKFIIYLKSVPE